MVDFKFIDLFSGIGGFHYGLARCGGKCVMASEIDPVAIETYEKNYGITPKGDISKIDVNDIPDFDLLCGGFPCQSFSNVGQKGGLDDPRGALIYQVIRLLKGCKPKAFILENVKGLLSHNKGETFKVIIKELTECGYKVYYDVLEAKDYGVPQIRKRVFVVGVRNDINKEFTFPKPIGCDKKLCDVMHGCTDREYAFTIRIGGRRSGIENKYNWDCYRVNGELHYITIEECLEVQGFPRDFYLAGNKDNQYKQVGNAVPTVVVEAIGKQLRTLNII